MVYRLQSWAGFLDRFNFNTKPNQKLGVLNPIFR